MKNKPTEHHFSQESTKKIYEAICDTECPHEVYEALMVMPIEIIREISMMCTHILFEVANTGKGESATGYSCDHFDGSHH